MKRVVITGMGAITPIGKNVSDLWEALKSGISGADRIQRFDTDNFKTNFACELKDYDPLHYFSRKEARKLDRFAQYGLVAAEEALNDAKLSIDNLDKVRTGVIFSSGVGGFETFENETDNFFKNDYHPRFNPFFITKIIANSIAGHLSIKYGLKGVNYCPVTACASSTQALIQGFNYIKWNKADTIICGGAEAPITPASIGGFNSMKALSQNNEEYITASRPFDQSRDGFVVGEGAGSLIIESLESAQRRNAFIHAEIVGGGEAADAFHITNTHPDGEGAYLAMTAAINEAGINVNQIDYLNAHATSTGPGDLSEMKAIERLFSNNSHDLAISANKSSFGHLLGAAGAVEIIATSLTLKNNFIPGTINTNTLDDQIPKEFNIVLKTPESKNIQYALKNSFGFGGHCAAVILKQYK